MRTLLALVMVFALALPALAQDVEPVPVEGSPELVYILGTVLVLAVLATVVLLGRPMITANAENVPPWLLDSAFSALNTVLAELERYVEKTPPTYDDEAVAALRREFEALRREIRGEPVPDVE